MKSMPYEIKQKLRQLAKAYIKAGKLENEVCDIIEGYGVEIDRLNANSTIQPSTEALAFIINSEEDFESSIDEIEEVFLHIINNELEGKNEKI